MKQVISNFILLVCLVACSAKPAPQAPTAAAVPTATSVPQSEAQATQMPKEVSVYIDSTIGDGECFAIGEFFPINVRIADKPAEWEGPTEGLLPLAPALPIEGGDAIRFSNVDGSVWKDLRPGETWLGSIAFTFQHPDGTTESLGVSELPFFTYTGRDSDGKFCVKLGDGASVPR